MTVRVLYIEDNSFDRELVSHALKSDASGFELEFAGTREELDQLVRERMYDLVLTDFNILGLTGLDVLELVREQHPSMPTIIVTGTGSEEIAVEAIRRGADDYVIKTPQHILRLPQTIRTVLERRQAEALVASAQAAKEEQQALLTSILNNIPDSICVKDAKSRYLFANNAFLERIGAASEESIAGKSDFNIFPEVRAAGYFQDEQNVLASGATIHNIEERDDGVVDSEHHWYLTSKAPFRGTGGGIDGIVCISRDITELRRSQSDLRRLATAIEQVAESIVITDLAGKIVYVNPAFERVTGYGRGEVIGQTSALLKSGRHDDGFYQSIWTALRAGHVWRGRFTNRRKDGTLFEEDATISPIRNESGQLVNYIAVKYEVTREVILERRLQQAQKLEAIGTLAGGIAHDFNNVLATILGYTELLLNASDVPNPHKHDLRQITTAVDRARVLINQILTFSRQGDGVRAALDLSHVLNESVKLLKTTLPPTTKILFTSEPGIPSIIADVAQMHQLVINLITNAHQSLPDARGTIRVSIKSVQLDAAGHDATASLAPGLYNELVVSDDGLGMSSSVLDRIFDPFFTTRPVGSGTGMGMASVHGTVKSHGGAITISSEEGVGTTVRIYLPSQATSPAERKVNVERTGSTCHGRILVVDDEIALAMLAQRTLERAGFTVTSRTNSLEAWELVKNSPDAYDLLITDLTMPEMTGKELATRIHAVAPSIPIIVTTGYQEPISQVDAERLGIVQFLQKPIPSQQLLECVIETLQSVRSQAPLG